MANDAMRETWANGASAWVSNEALLDELFAPVTAALTAAAELGPGLRMLDVGCGTGTLLDAGVRAGATVSGIDISPTMVEAAAGRVPGADVRVEDAQTAALAALPAAPFNRVVSRFGVMFFDDPVAAFANIRSAAAPGARLAFACWRSRQENPMFTLGTPLLLAQMEPVPAGPGPTSFEDPERVTGVLTAAGWSGVAHEPIDFRCDYGTDGVEARLAVILGTATGIRARAELVPRLGETGWAALLDDVRAELRRWQGDAPRLIHPAAAWVVTASA